MKKAILASCLILLVFMDPGYIIGKSRKGAKLRIYKTDGHQIKGELIAVRKKSILLMESVSSTDVSIGVGEIELIKIMRKPKTLIGTGLGLAIGAGVGALTGFLFGSDQPEHPEEPGEYKARTASQKALTVGMLFGLIGAIGGGITGAYAGEEEAIQIGGRTQEEIEAELETLRAKARFPDEK